MSYSEELNKMSRKKQILVEIDLDYCPLEFGFSPCEATSSAPTKKCYQTFDTCLDISPDIEGKLTAKQAYIDAQYPDVTVKTYKFCLAEQSLPIVNISTGEKSIEYLPLISDINYLPTEIKKDITVNARTTINLIDSIDGNDTLVDKYFRERYNIPSAYFFRKLIARNKILKNRIVRIYEGFLGINLNEYQLIWKGKIDNVVVNKSQVQIETVDLLKSLKDKYLPKKINCKLASDLKLVTDSLSFTDITNLESPNGYCRIGDEIIYYEGLIGTTATLTNRQWFISCTSPGGNNIQNINNILDGNADTFAQIADTNTAKIKINWFDVVILDTLIIGTYINNGNITVKYAQEDSIDESTYSLPITLSLPENGLITYNFNQNTYGKYLIFEIPASNLGQQIYEIRTTSTPTKYVGIANTIISDHSKDDEVKRVDYFPDNNPYDLLVTIMNDEKYANIPIEQIDVDTITKWKNWDRTQVNCTELFIDEETEIDKLVYELIEMLRLRMWVNENMQITITKVLPNMPSPSIYPDFPTRNNFDLSDSLNIIYNSTSIDRNSKDFITRLYLYWNKMACKSSSEQGSYLNADITIDDNAELDFGYGEQIDNTIYCRWISLRGANEARTTIWGRNTSARIFWDRRFPKARLKLSVELKDIGINTGDYIRLSSNEFYDNFGNDCSGKRFIVVYKEIQDTNRIDLTLEELSENKVCYFCPNEWKRGESEETTYSTATDLQKEYGFFTKLNSYVKDFDKGYHFY